ncbi:MAG: tetratricopeptide repeat protein, partial [Anaerolineaceae bacterium]
MISNISPTPQKVQMIDREHLLRLLKNGLEAKSFRFTRQAALVWLSAFPGDLEVNLYYVIAQLNEGRSQQAAQVLERILKNDPLYVEALKIGVELFSIENPVLARKCNGVLQALGEQPSQLVELPDWGAKLIQVKQMLANRRFDEAQGLLMPVMGDSTHPEMADLLHLEITSEIADATSVLNLARLYQKRWPECLQINLILAKAWMETGNDDEAVKMMHLCAANDASAQVPTRMWGNNFAYRPLYPSKMEVVSSFSVPAEVAGKLGMNILNAGPGTPSVNTFASYPKSNGQTIYDDSAVEETETIEPEMEQPIRTEVSSFDGYKVLPTEDGGFQEHPRFQENKQKP